MVVDKLVEEYKRIRPKSGKLHERAVRGSGQWGRPRK